MILEYKLINANKSLDTSNIKSLDEQINVVKERVNPNVSQCIAINGRIILEGEYHPDAIITYKVPRKTVDYGIDKFPEHLHYLIKELQVKFKLTKVHIKDLKKTIDALDLTIIEIEKQFEIIRNEAMELKKESDIIKIINNFERRYSDFNDCLISNLEMLDHITKDEVRKKLNILAHVIDDTIEKYL